METNPATAAEDFVREFRESSSHSNSVLSVLVYQWLMLSSLLLLSFFLAVLGYDLENGRAPFSVALFIGLLLYVLFGGIVLLSGWGLIWILNKVWPGSWLRFIPVKLIERTSLAGNDPILKRLSLAAGLNGKQAPEFEKLVVIDALEFRTKHLRNRNSVVLGTISASLIAAVVVVIYAGQLTSYDASAVSDTDKLKAELVASNNGLTVLEKYRNLLANDSSNTNTESKVDSPRFFGQWEIDSARRELTIAGLLTPVDVSSARVRFIALWNSGPW
jgi:hypothetical protein